MQNTTVEGSNSFYLKHQ